MRPYSLLAELTYRCPLRCPYCSNPLNLSEWSDELATAAWQRVFTEANDLGVVHLHLSGGEPLLRPDLPELIAHARRLGLYTNLITSGVGLTGERAAALRAAGLESVQISFQAATPELADQIAGRPVFAAKRKAAAAVLAAGLPLSLNVVLHRYNLQEIGPIIELAAEVGAERLELANTQYYGWGLLNRAALLPTREQLAEAERVVAAARDRLAGCLEIIWVLPDYYEEYPKPCMGGWGRLTLTVAPDGTVLPCPAAGSIPGLALENVRSRPLAAIWFESESFNRFRGEDWMPEPCRSCERRREDFGGCRCQAFLLAGDPAATDPVCHRSPHHGLVTQAVAAANAPAPPGAPPEAGALTYREASRP